MPILDPKINAHLADCLPVRDSVLLEMERFAEKESFPIVGPLVGRLCYQIVKMLNAQRVLEMGSGFGYSAYWMAQALPEGGRIVLTEASAKNLSMAKGFFQEGNLDEMASFEHGNALEIIARAQGQFDVILNDIDKEDYPRSLPLILPRLRAGGVLISDNMLWGGRVVEPGPDESTRGILDYTKNLYETDQLWTTIVPLRDGVAISLKVY